MDASTYGPQRTSTALRIKMSSELETVEYDIADIEAIVEETGTGPEAVIPILQAIQKKYRYLPGVALERVCELTNILPSDIEGVATFYTQFRREPVGKHVISLCDGTACHVKGSIDIHEAVCEELGEFGTNIGTAYQIYDDCIDLIGEEKEFGKTLRTDINKGKLTLPILNLLGSASDKQREKLHRLLIQKEPIDISVLASIADYVGSIEAAIDTGLEFVSTARGNLVGLPEGDHKESLIGIADFLEVLLEGCRQ